jgi:hypothetical protein
VYYAARLAAAAPSGAPAETNRSWDRLVQTIREGKKVVVAHISGEKVEAKLIRITGDSVTIHRRKRETEAPQSDAHGVRQAGIRVRNTLEELGAGAAVGGVAGGALPIGKPPRDRET